MKKLFAAFALTFALAANAATPTFAQVNEAIAVGNTKEAKVMMAEVLRKRPESVKAHTINAQLLVLTGANKEEIAAELALANKLKGSVQYASAEPDVVETSSNSVVKYIIIALCAVSAIIAAFLGYEYISIRGRKLKQNPITPEGENNEQIQETDRSNYSEPLSHHSYGKPIAKAD